MPISCFLNFIDDTAEGLVDNLSETKLVVNAVGRVGIGFGIRAAWLRINRCYATFKDL
jgi:hypothetical protein